MLTLVTSPFVAQIENDDASLSTSLVKRHASKETTEAEQTKVSVGL